MVDDEHGDADPVERATSSSDSPISRLRDSTLEVSTTPSGPPSSSRAATLAAETLPMLAPTSHTGTGAVPRSVVISARTSVACSAVP